ncbi:hypothetical protein DICA1_E17370 [Diutina catenulata]
MSPPVFQLLKVLLDPNVEKKLVLQMALKQVKLIGYTKVLAMLLGAAMVGVSTFIKIPQIQKIVNPALLKDRQSVARGLSLQSLGLESFNQLVHVVFNQQNRVPFVNYGESFLLGIQNVVLILLVNFYRNKDVAQAATAPFPENAISGAQMVVKPAAVMAAAAIFIAKIAPPELINFLEVLNIPISIAAKLPQIKANHDLQSTSHLSNITIRANVIGSLIRVYTTLTSLSTKQKRGKDLRSDYVLLAGYATSAVLNATVVAQSFIYKKDDKEKKQ